MNKSVVQSVVLKALVDAHVLKPVLNADGSIKPDMFGEPSFESGANTLVVRVYEVAEFEKGGAKTDAIIRFRIALPSALQTVTVPGVTYADAQGAAQPVPMSWSAFMTRMSKADVEKVGIGPGAVLTAFVTGASADISIKPAILDPVSGAESKPARTDLNATLRFGLYEVSSPAVDARANMRAPGSLPRPTA